MTPTITAGLVRTGSDKAFVMDHSIVLLMISMQDINGYLFHIEVKASSWLSKDNVFQKNKVNVSNWITKHN